jgi:RecA/RadA recombinase
MSGRIDGGIAKSGITMMAGGSGFGKTYIALSTAINLLKQGYTVLWYNTEFAINEDTVNNFGLQEWIDSGKLIVVGEMIISAIQAEIMSILEDPNLEKNAKLAIFIDSYAGLVTNKLIDNAVKEADKADMQTVKKKNELMTLVNGSAAKKEIPVVIINHTYLTQDLYPKIVVSGGTKVRFFSNVILVLSSKAKAVDKDKNIVGAYITAITDKSRFSKEQSKLKFHINYSKGLDKYFGLFDMFKDLGLIDKKGHRYFNIDRPDDLWYEKDIYCSDFMDPILEKHKDEIENLFRYSKNGGDAILDEIIEDIKGNKEPIISYSDDKTINKAKKKLEAKEKSKHD